jgi:hypothetical protein
MQRLADPTGETVGRHFQWRNASDEGAQNEKYLSRKARLGKISVAIFSQDAND